MRLNLKLRGGDRLSQSQIDLTGKVVMEKTKHPSVRRREKGAAQQMDEAIFDSPHQRFSHLAGHYDSNIISYVSGVSVEKINSMLVGSGSLNRWQPEEDYFLKHLPDAVVSHILLWRTRTAIRSRRRDLGYPARGDGDIAKFIIENNIRSYKK